MLLAQNQRIIMQIYRRAAGLSDPAYRDLLRRHAGCRSSTDPDWSQESFESAMAAIETTLWSRVQSGDIPDPRPSRYIHDERYWRSKLPVHGKINSRQYHAIKRLWSELVPYLAEDQRVPAYFAGLVARATGRRDLGVSALSSAEAASVLDALRDRLSYAIRQPQPVI